MERNMSRMALQVARIMQATTDTGAGTGCRALATMTRASCAAAKPPPPGTGAMPVRKQPPPPPGAPPAAMRGPTAAAPLNGSAAATPAVDGSSGSSSSAGSSSSGGGPGWFGMAMIVGAPAIAYWSYSKERERYDLEVHGAAQREQPPPRAESSWLSSMRAALGRALPSFPGSSSGSGSKMLKSQKAADEQGGFQMLPPSEQQQQTTTTPHAAAPIDDSSSSSQANAPPGARNTTHAAVLDSSNAAAAAADDALSAAADEFPGSSSTSAGGAGGAAAAAAPARAPGPQGEEEMVVQHIDMEPVHALFAEVAASTAPTAPSSILGTGSRLATEEDATRVVKAMTAAAAAAAVPSVSPGLASAQGKAVSSGELAGGDSSSDADVEQLCKQLGVDVDVSPAGLIAAANAAGLGVSSGGGGDGGTALPPQMVQLNQASSDARLLDKVVRQLSQRSAALQAALEGERRERAWEREAATKQEASLTSHFKELLREQARVGAQLTEAAVRSAEQALLNDVAAAHNQERAERLAALDELRGRVNALSLALDARTAQVRSAAEVNSISLALIGLSAELAEGRPACRSLEALSAACPDDGLVAAVARALPPTALSAGVPTPRALAARFPAVATAAGVSAYFSGEEGGVLARAVARLAVAFKMDGPGSSPVDAGIAAARAAIARGEYAAAAQALEVATAGTQAEAAVESWVADARARAAADQAARLLQAHAAVSAASVRAAA